MMSAERLERKRAKKGGKGRPVCRGGPWRFKRRSSWRKRRKRRSSWRKLEKAAQAAIKLAKEVRKAERKARAAKRKVVAKAARRAMNEKNRRRNALKKSEDAQLGAEEVRQTRTSRADPGRSTWAVQIRDCRGSSETRREDHDVLFDVQGTVPEGMRRTSMKRSSRFEGGAECQYEENERPERSTHSDLSIGTRGRTKKASFLIMIR